MTAMKTLCVRCGSTEAPQPSSVRAADAHAAQLARHFLTCIICGLQTQIEPKAAMKTPMTAAAPERVEPEGAWADVARQEFDVALINDLLTASAHAEVAKSLSERFVLIARLCAKEATMKYSVGGSTSTDTTIVSKIEVQRVSLEGELFALLQAAAE